MRDAKAVLLLVAMVVAVAFSAPIAEARPKPRPTYDVWYSVPVTQSCIDYSWDSWYIYNVDRNGDGTLDYTVFFYESREFNLGWASPPPISIRELHRFRMISPDRSLSQWAIAWYGYSSDGTCTIGTDTLGVTILLRWQIKALPRSWYQQNNFARVDLHMGLTVGWSTLYGGDYITIQDLHPAFGGATYTVQVGDFWSSVAGYWEGPAGWPSFQGYRTFNTATGPWIYSPNDFAANIQQLAGHPVLPYYKLATSTLETGQKGDILVCCLSDANGAMSLYDSSGVMPAAGYLSTAEWYPDIFFGGVAMDVIWTGR